MKKENTFPYTLNVLSRFFVDEENLMIKYDYPDFNIQQKAHSVLLQMTAGPIIQELQFSENISFEALPFLKSWWINHILKLNLVYKSYLENYKHSLSIIKRQKLWKR